MNNTMTLMVWSNWSGGVTFLWLGGDYSRFHGVYILDDDDDEEELRNFVYHENGASKVSDYEVSNTTIPSLFNEAHHMGFTVRVVACGERP